MPNLKNAENINSIVEIGNNHLKYFNEILKISNISRTWIFRFQNIEKKKFEQEKAAYENAKSIYEASETKKKNESIRNILIVAVAFVFFAILAFSFELIGVGILFLVCTGFFAYLTYRAYNRNTKYPYSPPIERPFPDKFGLGIEMNSGHVTTFTAIGDDGVRALRKLQNNIDDADVHNQPTVFNMNDYNITVENNDGLISAGDNSTNVFHREEQGVLWIQQLM